MALQVNVWVVYRRQTKAFRSCEGVVVGNVDGKLILSALPNALVLICQVHDQTHRHDAIAAEFDGGVRWNFQLLHFFLKPDLTRRLSDFLGDDSSVPLLLLLFLFFVLFLDTFVVFFNSNHFKLVQLYYYCIIY